MRSYTREEWRSDNIECLFGQSCPSPRYGRRPWCTRILRNIFLIRGLPKRRPSEISSGPSWWPLRLIMLSALLMNADRPGPPPTPPGSQPQDGCKLRKDGSALCWPNRSLLVSINKILTSSIFYYAARRRGGTVLMHRAPPIPRPRQPPPQRRIVP